MLSNFKLAQFSAAAYTKNFAKYETSEWKKFLTSTDVRASNAGYYGIAYINDFTKEIVIANSGTNLDVFNFRWLSKLDFSTPIDFVKDFFSDIQLYFGYVPRQFTSGADKFVDSVVSNLGIEAHNYKFITTGHSLGAVLSNLENAKLKNLGYEVSSVNIDSPGTKPIVENYIKTNNLGITSDNLDITTFNTPKHLVNNIHAEVGIVNEFHMPYKNTSFFGSIMEAINNHNFRTIFTKAFDKETGDFTSYHQANVEPANNLIEEFFLIDSPTIID